MKVFVASQWEKDIPKDHREYINALIEQLVSLTRDNLDQYLLGLHDLSVGPLRFGSNGACEEAELPHLLEKNFGRSDYASR